MVKKYFPEASTDEAVPAIAGVADNVQGKERVSINSGAGFRGLYNRGAFGRMSDISGQNIQSQEYDHCVVCTTRTPYKKDTPIDERKDYVKGVGQFCFRCSTQRVPEK